MTSDTYDIVTVGGGLGGAALAKVMAEHGARVRLGLAHGHVRPIRLPPQAQQRPFAGMQPVGCLLPALSADERSRPRPMSLDRLVADNQVVQ